MQTIKLWYQGFPHETFAHADEGSVWRLFVHGLQYPPERRTGLGPRVRLLEHSHPGHVLAELLDPWPDAPEYWPPESAERAPASPPPAPKPSSPKRARKAAQPA